jgi:hypothetical protein
LIVETRKGGKTTTTRAATHQPAVSQLLAIGADIWELRSLILLLVRAFVCLCPKLKFVLSKEGDPFPRLVELEESTAFRGKASAGFWLNVGEAAAGFFLSESEI